MRIFRFFLDFSASNRWKRPNFPLTGKPDIRYYREDCDERNACRAAKARFRTVEKAARTLGGISFAHGQSAHYVGRARISRALEPRAHQARYSVDRFLRRRFKRLRRAPPLRCDFALFRNRSGFERKAMLHRRFGQARRRPPR